MFNFYFLIQYKSGGSLKLVIDSSNGLVKRFVTRKDAKRYAVQNYLGIYAIYQFKV